MRITGGEHKGRRLRGGVAQGVRPTGSKVREALFNLVGQDLTGQSVLDATGGTGLLVAEAVSRGAAPAVVLERARGAVASLRRNLEDLGLEERVTVVHTDALRWDPGPERFDVVILDPPYKEDPATWVHRFLPLARLWLVLEHASRVGAPPDPRTGEAPRTRRYGDTALTLYPGFGTRE